MGVKENKVARGSIRTVMKHQMSYSGTKVPEFFYTENTIKKLSENPEYAIL